MGVDIERISPGNGKCFLHKNIKNHLTFHQV